MEICASTVSSSSIQSSGLMYLFIYFLVSLSNDNRLKIFPSDVVSRHACRTANSDYHLRHPRPLVFPQGKTRLPMDGFS